HVVFAESRQSVVVSYPCVPRHLPSFPTRRSSDLQLDVFFRARVASTAREVQNAFAHRLVGHFLIFGIYGGVDVEAARIHVVLIRSEEHTSELQSRENLVCRLLLEKKKQED